MVKQIIFNNGDSMECDSNIDYVLASIFKKKNKRVKDYKIKILVGMIFLFGCQEAEDDKNEKLFLLLQAKCLNTYSFMVYDKKPYIIDNSLYPDCPNRTQP